MVKCSECGYLAARNIDTGGLDEVDGFFRHWGKPPNVTVHGRNQYCRQEILPVCFARNYNLSDSLGELARENYDADKAVIKVINEERQCNEFTKWQQGFTPKEHREMLDSQFLIEMEEKRRREDRKWHWIEVGVIILISGLFTLLGAWIAGIR